MPATSPFHGPDLVAEVAALQKEAKKRMLDLDLDRATLAARLEWTPEHLSSVLNTGIRKLADPVAAVRAVHMALDAISAETAEATA